MVLHTTFIIHDPPRERKYTNLNTVLLHTYWACSHTSRADIMQRNDAGMVALNVDGWPPLLNKDGLQHLQPLTVRLARLYARVFRQVTPGHVPSMLQLHVFLNFAVLLVKCEAFRQCVGGVANVA